MNYPRSKLRGICSKTILIGWSACRQTPPLGTPIRIAASCGVLDPLMNKDRSGLVAALALLARDRGEFSLMFQFLIAPMIDDRTCVLANPHPYTWEFICTREANRFGWNSLLG